jgi:hypothetical protein
MATQQESLTSPSGIKEVTIQSESTMKDQGGGMVKSLEGKSGKRRLFLGVGLVVIVLAGVTTGYLLSLGKSTGGLLMAGKLKREVSNEEITRGTLVGVSDEKAFRDSAEGDLTKGGIDGEGSHHLVRPGGESQYVYLTSSIIDLDQFAGKKVKVWGETFAGQKAGWLMDVGRLEVLE